MGSGLEEGDEKWAEGKEEMEEVFCALKRTRHTWPLKAQRKELSRHGSDDDELC